MNQLTHEPTNTCATFCRAAIPLLICLFVGPFAFGAPRAPLPPFPDPAPLLYHADFDSPYWDHLRDDSIVIEDGTLIASWSGYALERVETVSPLLISGVYGGHTNLGVNGAVRLWVTPYWTSAGLTNGGGPGSYARLAEMAATAGGNTVALWSLQVTPDGNTISLISQSESGPVEVLKAGISWLEQSAHCVMLNYGSNTTLYVDGVRMTNGNATASASVTLSELAIGSTVDGTATIGGTVDQISCFGRHFTDAENSFYYGIYSGQAALGPQPPREFSNQSEITGLNGGVHGPSDLNGPGDCVTNGPVYLTNIIAWMESTNSTAAAMDVQGGTNGIAYLLYRSTNVAAAFASTNWQFVQFVYTCSQIYLTNQPSSAAFYRIGPEKDTDGDGMPDWWELQHGLNPYDSSDGGLDPDDDGYTNLQEYTNGSNPFDDMLVAWGDNGSGQSTVPWNFGPVSTMAGGGSRGGGGHTLVVTPTGTVIAWGANDFGQTNVPSGLSNVIAVAAGGDQSIALKSNGTVVQWGGTNDAVPPDLTNAIAISAGFQHVLALRSNGTVLTWGRSNSPANSVPSALNGVRAIGAGWNHNVALRTNGTVVAWGYSGEQLGWNLTNVPSGLTNVAAIAVGALHSVALRSNGTVVAWGWNYGGETNVPAGLSNVVSISAGRGYTLALQNNGTVSGWGAGLPIFPAGLAPLTKVAAGPGHALGIRSGVLTPLILSQPRSQSKLTNENATFHVSAWSRRQPLYQWQLNGTNIAGATNDTLTVTNVQAAKEGFYRAVVSNGAGSVTSAAAELQMIRAPVVLWPLSPQTVWISEGRTGVLSVNARAQGADYAQLNYAWYKNGSQIPWALNSSNLILGFLEVPIAEGSYWVVVSNGVGSAQSAVWTVKVGPPPGTVLAWGNTNAIRLGFPYDVTNAIAIAGGGAHSLVLREEGTVAAWGVNSDGQTTVPAGLTDAVAIAAGSAHSLALKSNGILVGWGRNNAGQTNTPAVTNAVSISAGGDQSLALLKDGTVAQWGQTLVSATNLSNVAAIASGTNFHVALLSNSTVVAWGANDYGQTNVPASLTNVVAVAAGGSHALALREDGNVVAWGSNSSGETNVPANLTNAMAVAAGDAYSLALRNDGTVVAWGDNLLGQTNGPVWTNEIKLIAAGAKHGLAVRFSPFVQYAVDVTKDLLLVYNSNSQASSNLCSYYLTHRPMVAGANVLSVACDLGEFTTTNNCDAQIVAPMLNWLINNPTKHPQYILLFYDIPTRITNGYPYPVYGSTSFHLQRSYPGLRPYVNAINAGSAADCEAYIDKISNIGTNYSPGRLLISAGAGAYGNTNYYFDDSEVGYTGVTPGLDARQGVIQNGASGSTVMYTNVSPDCGSLACHITGGSNVAGYLCWGAHSALGANYATNGYVNWGGSSGWWIIATVESFNGQRLQDAPMGGFIKWFSSNAFGGTNYSNTPVGAVMHTEEPTFLGNYADQYFGLWMAGRNFAICAWNSRWSPYFQAVGDPLLTK